MEESKENARGQSVWHLDPSRRRRGSSSKRKERAMQCLIELHIRRLVVSRIDKGEGFSRARGDAPAVLECVCDLARTLNALLSRAEPAAFKPDSHVDPVISDSDARVDSTIWKEFAEGVSTMRTLQERV